jgi:hypothetical protein
MKNGQRGSQMKTARSREEQYAEVEPDTNGHKPKFRAWLRGKFGTTWTQRHENAKPSDGKVGAPFTRVQHRTGLIARRRS